MSLQSADDEAAAVSTGAPRVSLKNIEANIGAVFHINAGEAVDALRLPGMPSLALLSVCFIVMRNGFSVIGKSAPASAANFNADLGRKLAYEDAIRQLWPLEGYALRDRLMAADAAVTS